MESLTAIVEPESGVFEVVCYDAWKRRRDAANAQREQAKGTNLVSLPSSVEAA